MTTALVARRAKDARYRARHREARRAAARARYATLDSEIVSAAQRAKRVRRIEKHGFEAEQKRMRANVLRHKYGIEPEDYERMYAEQGGRCAICRSEDPGSQNAKHFCVDHDHKTGEVRGLLCVPCNTGIGNLKDSPDLLRAALSYLCLE